MRPNFSGSHTFSLTATAKVESYLQGEKKIEPDLTQERMIYSLLSQVSLLLPIGGGGRGHGKKMEFSPSLPPPHFFLHSATSGRASACSLNRVKGTKGHFFFK